MTFCAIGAGLALGFHLARSGQMLVLECVAIAQPILGSYVIWKELARPNPRLRMVALGALFALGSSFGISTAVRVLTLLVALLLLAATHLQRSRLARVLTVAYSALLVGATLHRVFGPWAPWL